MRRSWGVSFVGKHRERRRAPRSTPSSDNRGGGPKAPLTCVSGMAPGLVQRAWEARPSLLAYGRPGRLRQSGLGSFQSDQEAAIILPRASAASSLFSYGTLALQRRSLPSLIAPALNNPPRLALKLSGPLVGPAGVVDIHGVETSPRLHDGERNS
jgi:hypothetical protein